MGRRNKERTRKPKQRRRIVRPKPRKVAGDIADLREQLDRRNRELDDALQQQIATSEVLRIIRQSPADAQPVFDAIVKSASRLCGAIFGVVYLYDDDRLRIAATNNFTPSATIHLNELQQLKRPERSHLGGRAILERKIVHVPDVLEDPEYSHELALAGGWRAVLAVPLLREGIPIGALTAAKAEAAPFSDQQIQLLKTFADQAVIAIENVRLFEAERQRARELSEALDQQSAASEVLSVISRSQFDLAPILQSVVDTAARLCRAEQGGIFRLDQGIYRFAAGHSLDVEYIEFEKATPYLPGSGTVVGRAAVTRQVARIDDVLADPLYEQKNVVRNIRSVIGVPLMREGQPIGVIALARGRVEPFNDREVELLSTFADQAVIAIENVRLFEGVEARTRELAKSLEDLRNTQDRLVQTQKLASLGQLTAGIAHEIKNPLNFVNNFSVVSSELIDELQGTLKGISFDEKARAEIKELTDTLRSNLDKVVQHGKRADAIVKNMLLHSREGSGEHRPVDINSLVEESLNLAYHGARAEKQGFSITLQRLFDPMAGEADLFPQDITRALLNFISNGFYAATKRRAEANRGNYEPILAAATKNLGDRVEITIRDNGAGIPPDVKAKIFNPFFTTKPAGEGTGLGLSISHDIIVKQHGGSIEVDTQPGEFTEIRVILPRAAALLPERS